MDRTGQRLDPTDGLRPALQPLLPLQGASPPLRACLLSGGLSRRMGRDKALLPHPEGGSWLERTLRLLLALKIPVTLYSRHESHLGLARALNGEGLPPGLQAGNQPEATALPIAALAEPEPWEGPLLALHRLMEMYPNQRLLLCPVDMPWLELEVLRNLLQAAEAQPQGIHLAHDGERRQPLLGVYPSPATLRADLTMALQRGERRLQGWLASQDCREVRLDAAALRNVNHPEALPTTWGRGEANLQGLG